MSFVAFKISDYAYTAEREQYSVLCDFLFGKYPYSGELCIFIAFFILFDGELDDIYIENMINNEDSDKEEMVDVEVISQFYEQTSQVKNATESDEDVIKNSLQKFLNDNVVTLLNIGSNYILQVFLYRDYNDIIGKSLPFQSDYVAILNTEGATRHINKLQKIFHKKVIALSDSVIVWPEGDVQSSDVLTVYEKPTETVTSLHNSHDAKELVSQETTMIPVWLDNLIFGDLGAKYQPSYERYSYNLDLNNNEAKIYLGTYFPRSFAESNVIFNHICNSSIVQSELLTKSEIRILDFGCGSGGASFGVLHSIENFISSTKEIRIIGVDGNRNSLILFDKISRFYNSRGKLKISLDIVPYYIESEEDFSDIADVIGNDFDFILTSKAIGEFERKKHVSQNGYELFSSLFAPLLSKNGIMTIIDVTIKDEASGLFLSQLMNIGVNNFLSKSHNQFKSIAPCDGLLGGKICERKCFFKKEIFVSHSEKSKDLTKFATRILVRQESLLDRSVFDSMLSNHNCVI